MAAVQRTPAGSVVHSLVTRLFARPYEFEFVQAVMILEQLYSKATPLGTGTDPRHEAVQLNGPLFAQFFPSQLRSLVQHNPDEQPILDVGLFGLGGPDGPLPYVYQALIQERGKDKDYATQDFLQFFQHRLLSIFYRVHCKYRLAASFIPPEQHNVFNLLRGLTGLFPRPLQNRQMLPDIAWVGRAGLLANVRRSLAGLMVLIHDYFKVKVQLTPYQGQWREIPAASRSILGQRNGRLGVNALAGIRAWDEHAGIRITLGPLSEHRYSHFQPGADEYQALASLTIFYLGPDISCGLSLLIQANQTQPVLSYAAAMRLGWSSWLGGKPGLRCVNTMLHRL